MDLVEIRKKAKGKKAEKVKKQALDADVTNEQQERVDLESAQGEEAPVGAQEEVVAPPEEPPAPEPVDEIAAESGQTFDAEVTPEEATEADPLDALFSFSVEGGLAIDESYLQALVEEDEANDQDVQQWLTFSLADEEYALTIDSVSEIIKPREVTDIPRVPDFISGIISLRGIIVPVFDMNQRLKLGGSELSSSSRIIVCQEGERLAGFLVDRINQVVNVPLANIEPPPTVLSGLDRDFVEGVGRVEGKMLILLHLSNVINAELI